ncbi:hypothetical protein VKS41_007843 [Umbelopsis sp. WA50703]
MEADPPSMEHLFNEASLQIHIPNLDKSHTKSDSDILTTAQREFAFYDEHLDVYLVAKIPHGVAGSEHAATAKSLFDQLDIHVEAAIHESAAHSSPPQQQRASVRLSSSPSSPRTSSTQKRESMRPENPPYFTNTLTTRGKESVSTIIDADGAHCCIYQMSIPVVYMKTRSNTPHFSITTTASYRPLPEAVEDDSSTDESEYDIDSFATINLLQGLSDGLMSSSEQMLQRFPTEDQLRRNNSQALTQAPRQTSTQVLTLKRSVRKILPVRSGISVKMRTTNASMADKVITMSVDLENEESSGCPFEIEKVEVQVANAVISLAYTKEDLFPITLETLDQMVLLYRVTLLADGVSKPAEPTRKFQSRYTQGPPVTTQPVMDERLQPQRVSIHVLGAPIIDGVRVATMHSKWNTVLDVSSMRQRRDDNVVSVPRLSSVLPGSSGMQTPVSARGTHTPKSNSVSGPRSEASPSGTPVDANQRRRMVMSMPPAPPATRKPAEVEVSDGIVVSFTVSGTIQVGRIFTLHIFLVNLSKHTRRFQVIVPNRKRNYSDVMNIQPQAGRAGNPLKDLPIEPYLEDTEFIRQFLDNETQEADLVALESNVRLSPLDPSTSQNVSIRFIAVKDSLHTIDIIQLVDMDTGFVTNLRNVLEIFVESA